MRLLAAKLRSLLKRYWPEAGGAEPAPAAGGVAVQRGEQAWALVDDTDAVRGFSRALLWGLHRGAAELHVLIDESPALGAAARQGACFRTPVAVWAISGAGLARVDPTPLPPEPPLDPRAAPFLAVIEEAGADPVIEWGTLSAEVLGLQVARVCADAEGAWLEIGIGKHDRLGHRLLWGDEPSPEALSRVVAVAVEARRSGDLAHPLNQLGRERCCATVSSGSQASSMPATSSRWRRRLRSVTSPSRFSLPGGEPTATVLPYWSPARLASTPRSSPWRPSSTRPAPPPGQGCSLPFPNVTFTL